MLGREGANISIVSSYGLPIIENGGDYGNQKAVYQEFVEFIKDEDGACYQAGVFFSSEPCGLGFRKGGEIIDNKAQFCGHIVK